MAEERSDHDETVTAAGKVLREFSEAQVDPLRDEFIPNTEPVDRNTDLEPAANELKIRMNRISSILSGHENQLPCRVDDQGRPIRHLFTGGTVYKFILTIPDTHSPYLDVTFARHPDNTYTTTLIWSTPEFRKRGGGITVPGGISGLRYDVYPIEKPGEQQTDRLWYQRLSEGELRGKTGRTEKYIKISDTEAKLVGVGAMHFGGDVRADWLNLADPHTPSLKPYQFSKMNSILEKSEIALERKFLPPVA